MPAEVITTKGIVVSKNETDNTDSASTLKTTEILVNRSGKQTDASIISDTSPSTKVTVLLSSPSPTKQASTRGEEKISPINNKVESEDYKIISNNKVDLTLSRPSLTFLTGCGTSDDSSTISFPSDAVQMPFGGDENTMFEREQPIVYTNTPSLSCGENDETDGKANYTHTFNDTMLISSHLQNGKASFDVDECNFPPLFQFQLDETYNSSLMCCNFLSSPGVQQDPEGDHQIVIPDQVSETQTALPIISRPIIRSPSHDTSGGNCQSKIDGNSPRNLTYSGPAKHGLGKTLANISQLSKIDERKKTQVRKSGRPLPLQKRHVAKEKDKEKYKEENKEIPSPNSHSSQVSQGISRKRQRQNLDETPTNSAVTNLRVIQHYNSSTGGIVSNVSTTPSRISNNVVEKCKCSKSKCLKLYCDCFQAGQVCTEKCTCKACENTESNSDPDGSRTIAIESILARRPDAFDVRVKKTGNGCSCKKNKCLKKYCDCFNEGIKCTGRCRCIDCRNGKNDREDKNFDSGQKENEYLQQEDAEINDGPMMLMLHTPIKHEEYTSYYIDKEENDFFGEIQNHLFDGCPAIENDNIESFIENSRETPDKLQSKVENEDTPIFQYDTLMEAV